MYLSINDPVYLKSFSALNCKLMSFQIVMMHYDGPTRWTF